MKTERKPEDKTKKKSKTRILKVVIGLILVLIVLVFFLVPLLISSNKGRQVILAQINKSIPGTMDFSDLSMGWFKGVKIADLGFNDNAGQVSVHVEHIAAKLHYGSILTGNLSLGQTVVDKPKVEINFRDQRITEAKGIEPEPSRGRQPVALPIEKIELVLNDGSVRVTDPEAGTVELSQINSKLNLRPLGQQTDFDLNMAVARADKTSAIQVTSRITPKQQTGWSLKGTSGNFTIDVNDLDLESLGPIFALAGLDVQAKGSFEGHVKSQIEDGRFENLSAGIKAENLDISGAKLQGDRLRTSSLDVNFKLVQKAETIDIDDLQIRTDWADVTAGGVVPTTFKSLADFLDADSGYSLRSTFNCDLAGILSQMPKTLGLKEGVQITSGQLNGNIETLAAAGQKQIQAQATLAGLEGNVEGKKIALSEPVRAEAQISSDETGIKFDKLEATAPFAKVDCTGNTELLSYNLGADLTRLQSEFGQFINIGQYQMAGQLLGKGQLSIKEDRIATAGSSTVKNLRFSSAEGVSASEPMADISFACGMDRKDNSLSIDSLQASTSFGQIGIQDGFIPLDKASPKPLSLAVIANNVDLGKLQPFAVLFASLPKEMQLSGVAESKISVGSEKNTYIIATDSTRIKGLKLTYPGRKPFEATEASLIFDAQIDPEQKAINIKRLELESPQIKIRKGEFSQVNEGGKTKLQGQVECEYDWAAVTSVASPYLPEGLTLQGTRRDTVSFASEYPMGQSDKLLSNLKANGKVGFEKAGYMGLNFGSTDVDIQVQNGLLKIAPFETTVNEGQFNFAGEADFKEEPALFKTAKPMQIIKDIKVNDETTGKLLKYVSPIFANAANVSGIANFDCEQLAIPLSAEAKNNAVVIGTISISKLRLQASDLLGQILSVAGTGARGADITLHPTRFVLQKGFLRYDDMQMDVGDNPINFKGVIGLDKSLDMTVTLPYTTAGRTVRTGGDTAGRRITLPLKGTVDKPQLDTGRLLEEQLKGQLEEQLRKGIEGLFE